MSGSSLLLLYIIRSKLSHFVRTLSVFMVHLGADLHRERRRSERVVQGDRQAGDSYQYDREH